MHPEAVKPGHSAIDGEKHKQFDREVREMVNTLTHRITGSSIQDNDDEHGIRIITLAGNNTGATMRSELDDKSINPEGMLVGGDDQPDALSTYVNSNFQSVNNSIMLGSHYNTNDPGVHMEISDLFENHGPKPDRHARKGKKKEREYFKSDHQSQQSD